MGSGGVKRGTPLLVRRVLSILLVAAIPAAAAAGVELHDKAQLEAALKRSAPCCVVDARSEPARNQSPLKDAVIYRPGVHIKPTAAVVVIADSDDSALRAGKELAKTSGAKEVLAVKGGIATWRALISADAAAGESTMPYTFVIPRNTCEQGKPLQELKFKRP